MTKVMKKILSDAMELDDSERVELAMRLMDTLDSITDAEWDSEWAKEIESRLGQLDRGEVKAVPLDEALRQIRQGGGGGQTA